MYLKEISVPINITSFTKIDSLQENKIDIQWNIESNLAYVIAVFVVRTKSSQDLLESLKEKSIYDANYTKKMSESVIVKFK